MDEELPQSPRPSAAADDSAINEPHPRDDSDNESLLSDIDDRMFAEFDEQQIMKDDVQDIDETSLAKLGKFKKKKRDVSEGADEAAGKKKKQERRRRDVKRPRMEDKEEAVLEPEIITEEERARRELDKKMDEALKGPKKKKKKKNEEDLDEMNDAHFGSLRDRMIEAAKLDAEAIAANPNQTALHKLAMVDDVKDILKRPHFMVSAVDNGILTAMKHWLEPLPNRSLPAYTIQKTIFEILGKMKVTTEDLTGSGIGKIVMFYTRDKRPEMHIKREAETLVRDWSRPILGRSDDYHSREIPKADAADINRLRIGRRPKQQEEDEFNPLAPPRNNNRTRVPVAVPRSYEVAPMDRVQAGHNAYARPIGAAGDDIIRRMKAKKQAQNKGRKSGMIIG
ncbi:Transcription factor iws1 [Rhizina undulata]